MKSARNMLGEICEDNAPCLRFVVAALLVRSDIDGNVEFVVRDPESKHLRCVRIAFDRGWWVKRLHPFNENKILECSVLREFVAACWG
jgi:hypothetical protein